ncbi:MAG: NAD(P)H-binding protein [Bacteroidia bacterium]
MSGKIAMIFGATGLIGGHLLRELIQDDRYETLHIFSRRAMKSPSDKVVVHVVDFKKPESFRHLIKGDELYCSLGTTIRKAGSREDFLFVDYEIPTYLAAAASKNKVGKFLIVTAMGADSKSFFFYNRVKGQIEAEVQKYPFEQVAILRPSLLLGEREEQRLGEDIGKLMMNIFSPLMIGPARQYRAIAGKTVAKAMIAIANSPQNQVIFSSDELHKLGDNQNAA